MASIGSTGAALQYLTPTDWRFLEEKVRRMKFGRGDVIIRQGSPSDTLFILRKGAARVEIISGSVEHVVTQLQAGDICGEMGFLESTRASASVIAEEEVEADAVSIEELQRLFEQVPRFAARFYHSLALVLSRRLRATSARLAAR